MQTTSDTGQGPDLTVPTETAATPPAPSANKAKLRGMKDAAAQLPRLQEHWPEMFSPDARHMRPLASGAVAAIMERMGWDYAYTRGIMYVWKGRSAYCRAVLAYDRRYHLDGTPSEEEVDDKARSLARARLDQIAEKRAKLAAGDQSMAAKSKPGNAPAGEAKADLRGRAPAPRAQDLAKRAEPAKSGKPAGSKPKPAPGQEQVGKTQSMESGRFDRLADKRAQSREIAKFALQKGSRRGTAS